MHRPRVPPLKRPSVISATLSPIGIPFNREVSESISRMPGSAARALVAHDHHVAGDDAAGERRVVRRLLAVEHARRSAERHLVLRHRAHLDHAAERGEGAEEDAERAALRVRVLERADALGVRVDDAFELLAERLSAKPSGNRG